MEPPVFVTIRVLCGLGVAGLALAACANIRAPSGGPLDDVAPFVAETYPDSGAVSVGAIDSIAIVFSEPMDKRSVEESFVITPEVEYLDRDWEDTAWILRLRNPLRESRTYVGFLGADTADRRANTLGEPWAYAFATGPAMDPGSLTGRVVGARYTPERRFLYVWPWGAGPPDSTERAYPHPPERLGQTDSKGDFALHFLPHGDSLRLCAFYDRERDREFDPGYDRWSCWPDPIVLPDTTILPLEVYISDPDEPGTLAGTAVDSACVQSDYKARLERTRSERDSLTQWMEGQAQAEGRGVASLSPADSSRIARELESLDEREAAASADSAYCTQPVVVDVLDADDAVLRSHSGRAEFSWSDVPPGIYRIRGFRDLDQDGEADPGEPAGAFGWPVELAPLRVLDDLDFELEAGEDAAPVESGNGVQP